VYAVMVGSVGLVAWVLALVVLPAPLAARILLLVPLVVAPRLVVLLQARIGIWRRAAPMMLAAALPLLIAYSLPTGPMAGAFVLPWLGLALLGALGAALHALAQLPSIVRRGRLPDLGADAAMGFLGVGATFMLIDRLGLQVGYSPAIILLTATHFHFAGFGLLGLSSVLARSRAGLRAPVLGLIAGIPLTAVGFVLATDAINAVGALLVGLSGIGIGVALLSASASNRVRWVARIAGVALLIGMPMGIAWSLSILSGQSFLDLDTMIRTHGALNATAVVLGVASFRPAPP
jgi:hypothetical protein